MIEEGQLYIDDLIRLIEKEGPITPRNLSVKLKVTVPNAVTQWIVPTEVLRC